MVVAAACAVLQVLPLSVLYSHVASASTPLTVTLLLLVMLSVLLLPVSAAKANAGVLGAEVSMVQLLVLLLVVAETLPAKSVCRTCTAPVA